jgi:hypothetical protein
MIALFKMASELTSLKLRSFLGNQVLGNQEKMNMNSEMRGSIRRQSKLGNELTK